MSKSHNRLSAHNRLGKRECEGPCRKIMDGIFCYSIRRVCRECGGESLVDLDRDAQRRVVSTKLSRLHEVAA